MASSDSEEAESILINLNKYGKTFISAVVVNWIGCIYVVFALSCIFSVKLHQLYI